MLAIRTILHPTDFSPSSAAAFHLACSLAHDHGARLMVVHVIPLPLSHGEVVARRQPNNFYDQMWEELERLQTPDPDVRIDRFLEEGDADAVIVRLARETPCDLIIMGTHGRTGLRRLLMGSVAEEVVRVAPCPVLTVKVPEAAERQAPELVANKTTV
jgi:nucleotide-binding universal stress UspA family protein